MDDYINRKEFLEHMKHTNRFFGVKFDIENFPAADVVPVAHAWWQGTADGYADGELVYDMWECSACGYDADGTDDKPCWRYCPNCGARMDGDSQ